MGDSRPQNKSIDPRLFNAFLAAMWACQKWHDQHVGDPEFAHARVEGVNGVGDRPYRFDIETEAVVIEVLKASGLPFAVISEEHGRTTLNCERWRDADYLLVLDGWDGSSHRIRHFEQHGNLSGLRGGPMFAVLRGSNPRYEDTLLSALVEPGVSQGLLAVAEMGTYRVPTTMGLLNAAIASDGDFAEKLERFARIQFPQRDSITDFLEGSHRVSVDLGIDGVRGIFGFSNSVPKDAPMRGVFWDRLVREDCPLEPIDVHACVTNLAELFSTVNGAQMFSCSGTRKWNLELIVAWLLLREAGGCMPYLAGSGGELRPYFFMEERVLQFAQYRVIGDEQRDLCLPTVFLAAPAQCADELASFFSPVQPAS